MESRYVINIDDHIVHSNCQIYKIIDEVDKGYLVYGVCIYDNYYVLDTHPIFFNKNSVVSYSDVKTFDDYYNKICKIEYGSSFHRKYVQHEFKTLCNFIEDFSSSAYNSQNIPVGAHVRTKRFAFIKYPYYNNCDGFITENLNENGLYGFTSSEGNIKFLVSITDIVIFK